MITREKLENHVSHLEDKVKQLKADCREAFAQGSDKQWEDLKKQKLKLKDEIEHCKKQIDALSK